MNQDKAFASFQKLLPQHGMSRCLGYLADAEADWIRKPLIRAFSAAYGVDLTTSARPDMEDYRSFNDFFTREPAAGQRPMPEEPGMLASPCDGEISQAGRIEDGQLLQAKRWRYSLRHLAQELADGFDGGQFATIYLAPRDYHRVHAPVAGKLVAAKAVPGALFSVNGATDAEIEGLFCRNERLICRLNTDAGDLLIVLVGALIVASIQTPWASPESPYRRSELLRPNLALAQGEELGRFQLGSSVILCTQPGACSLGDLKPGQRVRLGQALGRW